MNDLTIRSDKFDVSLFSEMLDLSPRIQDQVSTAKSKYSMVEPLLQDLFSSFYKFSPKFEDEVLSKSVTNKTMLEQMMETEEYQHLRQYTKLQHVDSSIAASHACDELLRQVEDQPELSELFKLTSELNTKEGQVEKLEGIIDSIDDILARKVKASKRRRLERIKAKSQAELKEAIKNSHELRATVAGLASSTQEHQRRAARKALEYAVERLKEESSMCEAWGSEIGQLTKLHAKDRSELAERISKSKLLKEVAIRAGRIKRVAFRQQETRIKRGAAEVETIKQGDDLARILPSEVAWLDSEFENEFWRKFTEKRLLNYSLKDKEKKGKGPMVICIDTSGSMRQYEREYWAKAVALALASVALREDRDFVLMYFNASEVKYDVVTASNRRSFMLMDSIETFLSGGTSFELPLKEAQRIMEESAFQKGDVVFITDGICDITSSFEKDFNEAKRRKEFKVFSIPVEDYSESLNKFSDAVYHVGDMAQDEAALKGVFSIDFSK